LSRNTNLKSNTNPNPNPDTDTDPNPNLKPRLHDTTCCQTGLTTG